jgi:hypothetical protein
MTPVPAGGKFASLVAVFLLEYEASYSQQGWELDKGIVYCGSISSSQHVRPGDRHLSGTF